MSLASEPQPVQHRFNVVLFGDTGASTDSSVINLIAGLDHVAEQTLAGSSRSALDTKRYKVTIQGQDFRIFDSSDWDLPRSLTNPDRLITAIGKAYRLVKLLSGTGGINLLVLCIRFGTTFADTLQSYLLFHDFLCQRIVPTVLVIADLEREKVMEN